MAETIAEALQIIEVGTKDSATPSRTESIFASPLAGSTRPLIYIVRRYIVVHMTKPMREATFLTLAALADQNLHRFGIIGEVKQLSGGGMKSGTRHPVRHARPPDRAGFDRTHRHRGSGRATPSLLRHYREWALGCSERG